MWECFPSDETNGTDARDVAISTLNPRVVPLDNCDSHFCKVPASRPSTLTRICAMEGYLPDSEPLGYSD